MKLEKKSTTTTATRLFSTWKPIGLYRQLDEGEGRKKLTIFIVLSVRFFFCKGLRHI